MRVLYGERRSALIDNIRQELGPEAHVIGGQAGMHLSVTLKGDS
jgi:DNA-binding transcriptional MocR family regulator